MATLKDIAQNLGLSVMAVSKALREAPDIAPATRARVLEEARRLHYVPNAAARRLRDSHSGLVGVVLPTLNDSFCANVLAGLEAGTAARELHLMAAASTGHPDLEWQRVTRLLGQRVEVLFIQPVLQIQHRTPFLEWCAAQRTPVIFLDRFPPSVQQFEDVGWVVADHQYGARLATRHLLELGHREILFLSGPAHASSAAEQLSGHQKALREAGLEFSDQRLFLGGFDTQGGSDAMARALAEQVRFSAVICGNDLVALGAMEILRNQGLSVPGDVSVVGCGDGQMAARAPVPLTTITQPQVDLGRAAFAMWWQWRQEKKPLEGRVLPVELRVRSSTGPAPDRTT